MLGVVCGPEWSRSLPAHLEPLGRRFACSPAAILPYAIDREDGTGCLHVASDAAGNELAYFHSLNRVPDHDYFRHGRSLEVRRRSLGSLLASREIEAETGLLKIDTEGNDLRVLEGLGPLRPELVMCEFVPPSVYPHWPLLFAEKLVAVAIDVGAHEGRFFQPLLDANLVSRVVLFEPHPLNAATRPRSSIWRCSSRPAPTRATPWPPTAPLETKGWPTFQQVLDRLRSLSPAHQLVVANDTLLFHPARASGTIAAHLHTHGADWLAISHAARSAEDLRAECDRLREQLARHGNIARHGSDEPREGLAVTIRRWLCGGGPAST